MFGMVLKAIDGKRYPEYLFKNLLNKYDLSHVAAIKWGNDNEDNAKLAYEKFTGNYYSFKSVIFPQLL